ncbi:ParM/StbA family protein [Chroococcidiopsis sp. CCNUC1]|jgi:hypothetical protein|uniref:ParM/StbA family protein n=1 Tax=Chroococcidiopsis sp. CCNUC1 TaxID=2653189 RepID=UPI002021F297|nr:hypothetical protein [Chroococcidiopsis sp. CCNUC1]URD53792.1 hypothetical protein M5J74_32375 [Chroococcidiopsis sp. CCNUC1]
MYSDLTIVVTVDLGASDTKAVYWNPWSRRPEMLWMKPQVAMMNPSDIKRLDMGGTTVATPETSAYVQIGASVYAVGALGRVLEGDSGLRLAKKETAKVKILAVVGAIAQKLLKSGQKHHFNLELCFLLPLIEYWNDEHQQQLKMEIPSSLTGFTFRGTAMSATLTRLRILPEGGGIFIDENYKWLQQGQEVSADIVSIAMFGYRNASILTFAYGAPPQRNNSKGSGPGYVKCLEQLIPGINPDDPALFEAFRQGEKTFRLKGHQESYDLENLRSFAHEYYFNEVRKFLQAELPSASSYRLLIAGGSAYEIQPELEQFLSTLKLASRVSWLSETISEIESEFSLEQVQAARLLDAFGAFRHFIRSKAVTQMSA